MISKENTQTDKSTSTIFWIQGKKNQWKLESDLVSLLYMWFFNTYKYRMKLYDKQKYTLVGIK